MEIAIVDMDTLTRNWWVVLLRGLAGIFFGVMTLMAPAISLAVLVLLYGAYAFADGVLALVSAVRHRGATGRWWMLLLEGIAGIGAGVVTLLWPGITALVLLYVIAGWALVTGGLELAAAIQLRKAISGEWLLALGGILSIAFGVLLIMYPVSGALALVLWIGAYALVFGAVLVALALRLRSWGSAHGTLHHAHSAA